MSERNQKSDPISRFTRFASRAGSPSAVASALVEEAFVRLWSCSTVRTLARPFIRPRYPDQWVFLVGCYNSGTTLLQRILAAHPAIAGLPREGVRFTNVLSNLETDGHHMMWHENYRELIHPLVAAPAAYEEIVADWSVFWKRDASIFIEKSIANTARIDWLRNTFPNTKFVGIHRNGYCIAEGLHRRAKPPTWYRSKTGLDHYSLQDTAHQWVTANTDMLRSFSNDERCCLVSFEEFVEQPVSVLEKLFAFIGVDPGRISFDRRKLVLANRAFEIRDPNPSSLARLTGDDRAMLAPVVEPMMRQLGYQK